MALLLLRIIPPGGILCCSKLKYLFDLHLSFIIVFLNLFEGYFKLLKMVRGTEEMVQQLEQRTWLQLLTPTVTHNSRTLVTEDSMPSPCVHWHMVILSYAVNSRPT